jgi:hypothetical protein
MMINTLTFAALVVAAEAWIVWLAYCMGHSNGWCDGMEDRRTSK